jgi:hypothetical protein
VILDPIRIITWFIAQQTLNVCASKKQGNQCLSPLKAVSLNPVHGRVYLMQHYVIKFVSDLRQCGGFLRVLQFPPPVKLTVSI